MDNIESMRKTQKNMTIYEAIKYQVTDRFIKETTNSFYYEDGEEFPAPDYYYIKIPCNNIKVVIKSNIDYSFYSTSVGIDETGHITGYWKEVGEKRDTVIGRPLSELTITSFDYVRVYSGGLTIFIFL